jgi:hypothetical protein
MGNPQFRRTAIKNNPSILSESLSMSDADACKCDL